MPEVVLLYSGGIDSTVLLYDLLSQGERVRTFAIDYGQTHRRELVAAERIAELAGVIHHHRAHLDPTPFLGSALTGGEGGVVVPNRNMVLIALAGALAESVGAGGVAVACHAGDYDLFPDCRPAFLEEAFRTLSKATDHRVTLRYPYVRTSKLDIVRRGLDLKVPFDLTWSCYTGGEEPCGECLACRERREALFLAGAPV